MTRAAPSVLVGMVDVDVNDVEPLLEACGTSFFTLPFQYTFPLMLVTWSFPEEASGDEPGTENSTVSCKLVPWKDKDGLLSFSDSTVFSFLSTEGLV